MSRSRSQERTHISTTNNHTRLEWEEIARHLPLPDKTWIDLSDHVEKLRQPSLDEGSWKMESNSFIEAYKSNLRGIERLSNEEENKPRVY